MKVALLARADARGIGHICWDVWKNRDALGVDRVAVVDMGDLRRGFADDLTRFPPDAPVLPFHDGTLPEAETRAWVEGADVLYFVETAYDRRLMEWANDAGVATVGHLMPEFHRPDWPLPTVTWSPTPWRMDTLPLSTRLVPVPVDSRPQPERDPGPLGVCHVAGHRAMGDRNGTTVVAQALRYLRGPMVVDVWCQDSRLPALRAPRGVVLRRHVRGVTDRWEQYDGADVLVLPRRYGGLCLPAHEAAACGLGLVMTDCPPNPDVWPITGIRCERGASIVTPCGEVPMWNASPVHLAEILNRLASNPDEVTKMREASREWAEAHSWERLGRLWRSEMERAAGLCR